MAITANHIVTDLGEVTITISAGDVTALAAFTTAEAITIDRSVESFTNSTIQARAHSDINVIGSNTPLIAISDHVNSGLWALKIVDDYSKGSAGELGTDTLTAVGIFQAFLDGRRSISQMTVTPAGGATGDIESTCTNIEVVSISEAETDALSSAAAMRVITLAIATVAKAAHA